MEVIGTKKFAPGIASTPAVIGATILPAFIGSYRAQAQFPTVTINNKTGRTITIEFRDTNGIIAGPQAIAPKGSGLAQTLVARKVRFSLSDLVPPRAEARSPAVGGDNCGPCISAGSCGVQVCGTPALSRVDFNTCAPC